MINNFPKLNVFSLFPLHPLRSCSVKAYHIFIFKSKSFGNLRMKSKIAEKAIFLTLLVCLATCLPAGRLRWLELATSVWNRDFEGKFGSFPDVSPTRLRWASRICLGQVLYYNFSIIRNYTEYILREGNITEKRKLFACLKDKLILKKKVVTFNLLLFLSPYLLLKLYLSFCMPKIKFSEKCFERFSSAWRIQFGLILLYFSTLKPPLLQRLTQQHPMTALVRLEACNK